MTQRADRQPVTSSSSLPLRAPEGEHTGCQLSDFEVVAAVVAGRWLEITESETHTHATPSEIMVASSVDRAGVRAAVLCQAALVGAGSLGVAWSADLRHNGRRNRAADRFVTLEVPRALRERAALLPSLTGLADSVGDQWPTSSSAAESLQRAQGREPLPEPPTWFGRLAPNVPTTPTIETTHRDMGASDSGDESEIVPSDTNQHAADLTKLLAAMAVEVDDNWLLRKLRRSRRASAGSTSSEVSPKARSRVRRRGGDAGSVLWRPAPDTRHRAPRYAILGSRRRGPSRLYPEFDIERMAMRPDHCTVFDIEATDENTGITLPRLADPELRRKLARVVLTPAPSRHHSDGDELDLDAAVDSRANFVATGQTDERVWLAPRARRPDLAVLILVDMSGSVSSTASGISTHRRQIELVEVITDALYAVGARTALHGFRSQDRRNVEMVTIVPFGTPWDDMARKRLHGCEPCGFTRLGAAIRRATDIIDDDHGAARRVLMVVSDGVAYDSGYEGSYAEADTRMALREANARAVATLCVTVGADTSDAALGRVFGAAPRVRARVVGDLRDPLAAMLRTALRSTSAGRSSK